MGTADSKQIASEPLEDLKPPKPVVTCHEWKLLLIGCFGEGCESSYAPTSRQHAACGGYMEINSQALIRCAKCRDPYAIIYVFCHCEKHRGNFLKRNKKNLVAAMMISAAMYQSMGADVWAKSLLASVSKLVGC